LGSVAYLLMKEYISRLKVPAGIQHRNLQETAEEIENFEE
jgi:hypothetical protein